jgi:hypothetical protein
LTPSLDSQSLHSSNLCWSCHRSLPASATICRARPTSNFTPEETPSWSTTPEGNTPPRSVGGSPPSCGGTRNYREAARSRRNDRGTTGTPRAQSSIAEEAIWDIRDPCNPRRVAYFIQAPNKNTKELCGTYQGNSHYCRKAIFSDHGEVDDRGYIYNMDRAGSGLTILKLTGDALAAVGDEGPK